jgi:hypothetical protein
MTQVPFLGPKLKIERAVRHINELQAVVKAFLARDPHPVIVEDDEERKTRTVRVRMGETVPVEVSLIAGDAIHNLRSALDIMICDIAAMFGDHARRARFPFARDANELETPIKEKVKRFGVAEDVIELIRALKPYDGGNRALRGLHQLNVIDKHQLIVAAADKIVISHCGIQGPSGTFYARRIGDGFAAVVDLEPVRDQKADVTVQIAFGNGPFQGEPIVPTLLQLAQLVSGIVETFQTYLFGPRKP